MKRTGERSPRPASGEGVRPSIACGFLHAPRLVLLDEPLTGLDPLGVRPLRGARILAAEIAVPFGQAVAAQWLLVALWLACAGRPFPPGAADRLALAAAMAIAAPAISAAGYVAANGLAVLYPDWAGQPVAGASPLEPLGPRNLVGLATTVLAIVAPAAVAGAVLGVVAAPALGAWALPAGALAGAAIVAIEAAAALRVLGRAFERVDASAWPTPRARRAAADADEPARPPSSGSGRAGSGRSPRPARRRSGTSGRRRRNGGSACHGAATARASALRKRPG